MPCSLLVLVWGPRSGMQTDCAGLLKETFFEMFSSSSLTLSSSFRLSCPIFHVSILHVTDNLKTATKTSSASSESKFVIGI